MHAGTVCLRIVVLTIYYSNRGQSYELSVTVEPPWQFKYFHHPFRVD